MLADNDLFKCWDIVKRKIKQRITILQQKQWNEAEEGRVLKQYKRRWWVDRVINDISDPMIHVIRRMRIGNSDLNSHQPKRGSRLCNMCDNNSEETNEHYLLRCEKYENEREELKMNVKRNMSMMNMKFSIENLLGLNQRIMSSKMLSKNYFNHLKNILVQVLNFIRKTKRFEKKIKSKNIKSLKCICTWTYRLIYRNRGWRLTMDMLVGT